MGACSGATVQPRCPPMADVVGRLLDALYAAVLDPSLWASFLDDISALTASGAGWFMWHDDHLQRSEALWIRGVDEDVAAEYPQWSSKNIFIQQAGRALRSGSVLRAEDLVPDREVLKSEFFDGFLRRAGILHHTGVSVFQDRSLVVALMLAKRIGEPSHTDAHLQLVRRLVPHIQRAVSVQRRLATLEAQRSLASDALDVMPIGVAFLAGDGRLITANRVAMEILGRADGLSLGRAGDLSASRPLEAARLARLVSNACATGSRTGTGSGGAVTISRPSGLRPYALLLSPLRPTSFSLAPVVPAAIAFVSDPERTVRGGAELLRSLYGLTPAESEVATLLLDGKKVSEIQDELGITENTVRTHVRKVLEKVQARGQGDLIRILLAGPAGLGPEASP